MHKSQIALRERWKWHFQASRFQKFLGEQTPLAAHASGARVPPHLYYPCYGTELSQNTSLFSNKKQAAPYQETKQWNAVMSP